MNSVSDVLTPFLEKVVVQIVNPLILLLVSIAFMYFLWGVFNFIRQAGDADKRAEGQQAILWGLVGLVIIFGAYGIIRIVTSTFGLDPVKSIQAQ